MTQSLYAVFQEDMGGSELQGLVTSLEAALAWVLQLHKIYRLTHFDPILPDPEGTNPEREVHRWEALYGSWEIRKVPILDTAPVLEPPAPVLLTLRLQEKVDPGATIKDLPPVLQEVARAELEAVGADTIAIGVDGERGWFVLHRDSELVYVILTEREPSATQE